MDGLPRRYFRLAARSSQDKDAAANHAAKHRQRAGLGSLAAAPSATAADPGDARLLQVGETAGSVHRGGQDRFAANGQDGNKVLPAPDTNAIASFTRPRHRGSERKGGQAASDIPCPSALLASRWRTRTKGKAAWWVWTHTVSTPLQDIFLKISLVSALLA